MDARAIIVLLLAAGTAGCAQRPPQAHRVSTLVVGTAVDIVGVNQLMGDHGRFGQDVIDLMFLHLFRERPDLATHPPTFEPQLAEAWSWSEDGLTLTVTLRDARWSDGQPVTSADVVWTFAAQRHPDVAWAYAHSKDRIESIRALDAKRFAVRFAAVYPSRLADLNVGVILPRHRWQSLPLSAWRSHGDWFLDNLEVNGPYRLKSWHRHDEIVLERNPSYYRKDRPRIDRVVFRVVPRHEQRVGQLLAGDLDFCEGLAPSDLPRVEVSRRARVHTSWHRQYSFIVWNGCRPPFEDRSVRLALTLAIDRRRLVEALWRDTARIGVSPVPRSAWAADPTLEPWPYDPRRSRRLLAAAGWVDSDGDGLRELRGRPFRFELSTNADNRLRMDAAQIIQQQLAAVGVDARPVGLEFNTLVARNLSGDYDATIAAWGVDTSLDLGYAFHSESIDGGYNYGCYESRIVDRLIDETRRQPDLEKARQLLFDLQRAIHVDQPYTFLWEPRRLDGLSRRLRGAAPSALGAFVDLEEWWLAPHFE